MIIEKPCSAATRMMCENPNWKREVQKTIEEHFYYKCGFIKISNKFLTLKELSKLAISIGIVSPNETDRWVYGVEGVENKLSRRLKPLLPRGTFLSRKKRKGRSIKYFLNGPGFPV
ncbi:MAG: hypothetical protein GY774_33155 [Planctomycetes bacterium]|nr:hypothetical protein [Planctomycetota bacterium]